MTCRSFTGCGAAGWPAYNEVMYNTYSSVGTFQTGMSKLQIAGYLSIETANTEVPARY